MGGVLFSEMFDLWQPVIILELLPSLEGFIKTHRRPAWLDLGFDREVFQ
jgi:hypothetical protein